jgi:hypothetical protein
VDTTILRRRRCHHDNCHSKDANWPRWWWLCLWCCRGHSETSWCCDNYASNTCTYDNDDEHHQIADASANYNDDDYDDDDDNESNNNIINTCYYYTDDDNDNDNIADNDVHDCNDCINCANHCRQYDNGPTNTSAHTCRDTAITYTVVCLHVQRLLVINWLWVCTACVCVVYFSNLRAPRTVRQAVSVGANVAVSIVMALRMVTNLLCMFFLCGVELRACV